MEKTWIFNGELLFTSWNRKQTRHNLMTFRSDSRKGNVQSGWSCSSVRLLAD